MAEDLPNALAPGWYWVLVEHGASQQTFDDWLRFNRKRVKLRSQAPAGHGWTFNLFEVLRAVSVDYAGLPGPISVAPNGADTTYEDVVDKPEPAPLIPMPEVPSSTAGKFGLALGAVAGVGLLAWVLSRGEA